MAEKYTFKQFQAQYPDDDACLLAILKRRYETDDVCPICGQVGKLSRVPNRRAFACKGYTKENGKILAATFIPAPEPYSRSLALRLRCGFMPCT